MEKDNNIEKKEKSTSLQRSPEIIDERNFQIDLANIQIDESYKTTMLEGIIATVFGVVLVSFSI